MSDRADPDVMHARKVYLEDSERASFVSQTIAVNEKRDAMEQQYRDVTAARQFLAETRADEVDNEL
eukprot:4977551-Alexandrium_andersonii.AAC.1